VALGIKFENIKILFQKGRLFKVKFIKGSQFCQPQALFLVILGTSSFPASHEVHGKITENIVLSCERPRIQVDLKYGL